MNNFRLTLTLFLLFSFMSVARAQIVVEGKAVNAANQEPLPFATAMMHMDTTLVARAETGEDGAFRLNLKKSGTYRFQLVYMSASPVTKVMKISEGVDTIRLGNLELKLTDYVLRGALVSTTLAKMEQKDDTTVYNAGAYRVPEGSTLEALIKQLPGVEVGDDGTIKWNGEVIKEFLINGKDFFKGNTNVAMKNLPTDLVSKVKAYKKKSDYAEQTGIDDGEEDAVLDITTKRALNESWISNIDLSYGTKKRYGARLFISRFDEKSYISIIGAANNVNDRGMGGSQGFGGGGGLTASKMAAVAFNVDNGRKRWAAGRVEFGGSFRYNHRSTDNESVSSSETFLTVGSGSSFSNSRSKSFSSSDSFDGNLNFRWNPDSLTSLSFRPNVSFSRSSSKSNSRSATFNDDPYSIVGMEDPLDSIFKTAILPELKAMAVNSNYNLSKSRSNSFNAGATLNLTRRLGTGGRNVSLNLQGSLGNGTNKSYSISNLAYYQRGTTDFRNIYNDTPSKNYRYSARLGYVEPIIANHLFAEFRYEYSYRYTDSERNRYNLDDLDTTTYALWTHLDQAVPLLGQTPSSDVLASVVDAENSRYATYRYQNHRINVGIRYNTESIRFSAGLALNPEHTKLDYTRPALIDTVVTRNVFPISPDVRLRYSFSRTSNLEINYRGSSSQPSMTDLLDVWDDSNPLHVSGGNPGLKPSWTNTFNINYRGNNTELQQNLGLNARFSQTSRSISSRVVYDESTGVRYSRPDNINGNWSASGSVLFSTALGYDQLFNLTTNSEVSYRNSVGYVSTTDPTAAKSALLGIFYIPRLLSGKASGTDYSSIYATATNLSQKNTTRDLTVNETLRFTYKSSYFDVSAVGSVRYNHARATIQKMSNLDTWQFYYGASANFNTDFGLAGSTDIRMRSRRGYSVSTMNTNELLWNAQLSYSFLKGRTATVSLQWYDILGRQSNVSRSISAMSRSDSWNNAINSYFLVHFIYKLNFFGKSAQKARENAGERFRDRNGDRMPGMRDGGNRGDRPMGGGFGGRR